MSGSGNNNTAALSYAGITAGVSALALGVGYWLGLRAGRAEDMADDSTAAKSAAGAGSGAADADTKVVVTRVDSGAVSPLQVPAKQPIVLDATTRFKRTTVRAETKDPVEPEIDGDVFDRARVMIGFSQQVIEEQVALVLGVGGIGSTVCFALARLGVKKMYLVDRDTVDASNLNRQMLFGVNDVGKRKVSAALETLLTYHNLRTELVPLDIDAVLHWDQIVAAARDCTVIFNNIDYGACFDLAASALAKRLHIPYLAASTYAFNVELTLAKGGVADSCFTCMQSVTDSFGHWDVKHLKQWSAENGVAPDGLLTAELLVRYCASGARKMAMTPTPAGSGAPPHNHVLLATFEAILRDDLKASNGIRADDFPRAFCNAWKKRVVDACVPSRVASYASLAFIPRDPAFPTRTVGSWVCVCVGGALLLVNKWVQHVMRPHQTGVQKVHTWSKVNLGMENGGYAVESFLNEQDLKFCTLCKDMSPPAPPAAVPAVTPASAAPAAAAAAAVAAAPAAAAPAAAAADAAAKK